MKKVIPLLPSVNNESSEKLSQTAGESRGKTPQSLRGFKDILPADQPHWEWLRQKIYTIVTKYNFQRIDPPLMESTSLFRRSVGDTTDIVEKEMFSFVGLGGDHITVRPEATASIARASIEHGMVNWPQPVKLFYIGPMFRYERPQSGRQRQFHQFGLEMLGEVGPAADAQILLMTFKFCHSLGIDVTIDINSIGCTVCREEYKKSLVNYYKPKRNLLCKDCQRRLVRNPLRILDCKEENCRSLREDAPQIVDALCDECQQHFMRVLEFLDDLGIPYNLNPYLVRGLDYYNRTTFEIFVSDTSEKKQSQDALGGGGRYDLLVEQLGGRPTPAIGMALGLERILHVLKEKEIAVPQPSKPTILLAQIGAPAKVRAMKLFEKLYDEGFHITENFVKDSLKAQLELADKLGCRFVLIIGQKEVLDNTVLIRDMEAGIQEVIDINKVNHELKKKLENISLKKT